VVENICFTLPPFNNAELLFPVVQSVQNIYPPFAALQKYSTQSGGAAVVVVVVDVDVVDVEVEVVLVDVVVVVVDTAL
jgi:hypothetical protein